MLAACRIVLVETHIAANLGAAARVMRNFGLKDLVLVNPQCDPADREARKLSTHGEAILDSARIVPELSDAVADCILVAGTSARTGGLVRRQSVGTPREIVPHLVDAMASGPVALVFGREANGLTDAEVTRCHHLITIPADTEYPALNLAQAVAICVYELHTHHLAAGAVSSNSNPLATFADQERMFEKLRTALEKIHFLYGAKADSLMHGVRHLLGKARLTPMEVDLLNGLARQINWFVDREQAAE